MQAEINLLAPRNIIARVATLEFDLLNIKEEVRLCHAFVDQRSDLEINSIHNVLSNDMRVINRGANRLLFEIAEHNSGDDQIVDRMIAVFKAMRAIENGLRNYKNYYALYCAAQA